MIMKRYNIVNNSLGWLCFVIAAVTYLLTLEPTASFWDCPEFITQGYKLEIGHPPGNPIFMLAARFAVNFAFGDVTKVALMVNAMSALLSAGTILLLFWTITHFVKKLIVADDATEVSLQKMLVIMGSGLCGALVYTWSDTFWFSAVEGEVYAFSSFCTALVVWLILKWENRADDPSSDRYLILIAYIIGVSIAVHLLNLLCIPAIVLVIYYRKWKNTTAKGSLIALGVSAVIVGLILYGLVPGFIEISQYFELFFVNTLGWSFNSGVLVYAVILVAVFVWAIAELYKGRSLNGVRWSVLLAMVLSGIFFIGDSLWIPVLLTALLAVYLWMAPRLRTRVLSIAVVSVLVIFVGYSSYALLLIRSSANPPMNQNTPDNVFDLASYLNREQYGDRPLLYGNSFDADIIYRMDSNGNYLPVYEEGPAEYSKVAKANPSEPDKYIVTGHKRSAVTTPELNMLFPRMYSGAHAAAYRDWTGMTGTPVDGTLIVADDGTPIHTQPKIKPTQAENLRFFLAYQLNHMYWRYFMWNFAGRQNDIAGNGEPNHGNWISGIPVIDNPRLGDQSLLPYEEGEGNKGHNVFYLLPLLMGIIGLVWQAFHSKRGIEQFWVVFFLFFMTGIAIVLYLNQTPSQPRERDYAFAGSFYSFAIWVGMGVAGLTAALRYLIGRANKSNKTNEANKSNEADKSALIPAGIAAVVGILVPIQMVSQTWDDHDRSGRYTARDFGMNYLNSLDPNAIIFTNGDNDTFPLWYAQEVEGVRTDVKVVNQSYLTTPWYVNMMKEPSYQAHGIDMLARPTDYAYDRLQFAYFDNKGDSVPVDALTALRALYSPTSANNPQGLPMIPTSLVSIPVDVNAAVKAGRITPAEAQRAENAIVTNLANGQWKEGMSLGNTISLDMLATSVRNGWNRPVYFALTVPDEYYLGMSPYMRLTGMAYEVTPLFNETTLATGAIDVDTDRAYRNITERYRWGGLDVPDADIYLDETVRRMVTSTRLSILNTAEALVREGLDAQDANDTKRASERFTKALNLLNLMEKKLPVRLSPLAFQDAQTIALLYNEIGRSTGNKKLVEKGLRTMRDEIMRYAGNVRYYQSLNPTQYAALQNLDKYIDQTYLITLLSYYREMGGDAEKLLAELQSSGVDVSRLARNADRANAD